MLAMNPYFFVGSNQKIFRVDLDKYNRKKITETKNSVYCMAKITEKLLGAG
jgi:hypothetical protein